VYVVRNMFAFTFSSVREREKRGATCSSLITNTTTRDPSEICPSVLSEYQDDTLLSMTVWMLAQKSESCESMRSTMSSIYLAPGGRFWCFSV
jgi:hypothetical protein